MFSVKVVQSQSGLVRQENAVKSSQGSLVVTLANPSLAKDVISAKIKWKKRTTSQLVASLVEKIGLHLTTIPSAIDINKCIPKEVYNLQSYVYKKSKEKDMVNNFVMYMREGIIYVLRKGERPSTAIFSINELDNFLGLGSAHNEVNYQ